MKIRTLTELQEQLDEDLAWRKRELITLLTELSKVKTDLYDKTAHPLLRSGIALLYAHWEGFIKRAGTVYLNYVSLKGIPNQDLKNNFIALSIRGMIIIAGKAKTPSLHNELVDFFVSGMPGTSNIPYDEEIIETRGNLNAELFKEIVFLLGLPYRSPEYVSREKLIDETLLKIRNDIAHGKGRAIAVDTVRFREIHDEMLEIIDLFKNDILNAALLDTFKRI